jgi:hypothetical protein
MPLRWSVLPVFLFAAFAAAGEGLKPMTDGAEGKRAFDDLAAYYANRKSEVPYKQAITDLAAPGAKAKTAAAYLTALFKQLFADESNGRAPWQRTPFFGGNPICDAREFRKVLAQAFAKDAQGDAALDPVLWLIESEKDPKNQAAAMEVLKRIKGGRATETLKKLLEPPHPNAAIAKGVIDEIGERGLRELAPCIAQLCQHYRASIREAARAVATKLGNAKVPDYKPENAFTPWLESQLKDIAAMVPTEIPKDAAWMHFTTAAAGGPFENNEFSGWKIGEKDGKLTVLDYFGAEVQLDKSVKASPRTLAEEVKALLDIRASNDIKCLSRGGTGTQQFESASGFVTVPEALVAAWCYARGDKANATALLFPRIDATGDDRWIGWATRDMLGTLYQHEMLNAFSHGRDYARALALAQQLAKPVFNDCNGQARAKALAEQLAKRGDDFKTFTLPEAQKWAEQKKNLKREEQIKYLVEHLRLLNCIQMGQPGDVSYPDEQYAKPNRQGGKVINPYVELQGLKLDLADLPTLAPFVADETFMPTFSYWRDFHPKRTLHQVNWAVAELMNETAKRDLADLRNFSGGDEAGKKKHVDKILEWCKANAGKTRDQLTDERPKRNPGGPRIDAP